MIDENLLLPPRHATFREILHAYGLKLRSFSIPPKERKTPPRLFGPTRARSFSGYTQNVVGVMNESRANWISYST